MDIKKILKEAKQHIWPLLGIVTVVVLAMITYLFIFAKPTYEKSTQILVNQTENSTGKSIESQTIQADLQLVNTYSSIITSPRILNIVQKKINNKYSLGELAAMTTIGKQSNSQVFTINVANQNADEAAKITNLIAETFINELPKIMSINNVTQLSEARYNGNEQPIKPNKSLMLLAAVILGWVLAFMYLFLRLFFQRTITDVDQIEEELTCPLFGELGEFLETDKKNRAKRNKKRTTSNGYSKTFSVEEEQVRLIRDNIEFSSFDSQKKIILVTSPEAGTGKSTLTSKLAIAYAQKGLSVLLVDGDLRKPTLHEKMNIPKATVGLSNVIVGNTSLEESIQEIVVGQNKLSYLASGTSSQNANNLLSSNKMKKLIKQLKETYDLILIDSPPVLMVSDAQILASLSDGVLLVFRYKKTLKEKAIKSVNKLSLSNAHILGWVLNGKKNIGNKYYY